MNISVSLPLDSDDFLRRQCPHCQGEFKWHHGPANDVAEAQPPPPSYYCPLCGEPAAPDDWTTYAQLDYARGVALPAALRHAQDELADMFRGSKHIKYQPGSGSDFPDAPTQLVEPDDMRIIASPCHSWEPVKLPEELNGPFHCLVCGSKFAV